MLIHNDIIAIKWESEDLREGYQLFTEPSNDHQFIEDFISSTSAINSFNLGKCDVDKLVLLIYDRLWDVMNITDDTRLTRNLLFKRGFTTKVSAEYLVERTFSDGSRDDVTFWFAFTEMKQADNL